MYVHICTVKVLIDHVSGKTEVTVDSW